MKKKSSTNGKKVTGNARRPQFCDAVGVETNPLGGIALRVLMTDIRKHKLGNENATEKAASKPEIGEMPTK